MEWINVNDRLPKIYDFVLVFAHTKGTDEPNPISFARLISLKPVWEFLFEYKNKSGCGVYQDLMWSVEMKDITHWMPLTPPPNKIIVMTKCDMCGSKIIDNRCDCSEWSNGEKIMECNLSNYFNEGPKKNTWFWKD